MPSPGAPNHSGNHISALTATKVATNIILASVKPTQRERALARELTSVRPRPRPRKRHRSGMGSGRKANRQNDALGQPSTLICVECRTA